MKIGYGNKIFDEAFLAIFGSIVLLLFLISIFRPDVIWAAVALLIGFFFQLIRTASVSYIIVDNTYFHIARVFRKSLKIPINQFHDLESDFSFVLFSNYMRLYFNNGISFRIYGGADKMSDVQASIEK